MLSATVNSSPKGPRHLSEVILEYSFLSELFNGTGKCITVTAMNLKRLEFFPGMNCIPMRSDKIVLGKYPFLVSVMVKKQYIEPVSQRYDAANPSGFLD